MRAVWESARLVRAAIERNGPLNRATKLVERQATLAVLMRARRRGLSVLRLRQAM
jgi:hypothetical protein